ncbi:MAG: hypothetical protein MJZ73_05700 [Bacteroidaceae bacterium]|nr:hypothetical protein [Bacteroidaceae bacterium]
MEYEYDNRPTPEPESNERSIRVIIIILFMCIVCGAIGYFEIWDRPEEGLYDTEETSEPTTSTLDLQPAHVVYFNVKTSHGNVRLHTGMTKDSILILMGEPDEFSILDVGGDYHEDMDYHINQSAYCDLSLEVINGILVNAHKR